MARHLVGLQAQENLPPYLSLAARLTSFDPYDVTAGLEDRSLVRFLTMRGTVHLLVADDALSLRQWTAPVHEREIRISQNIGPAREVDRDGVRRRALRAARRRPAAAEGARRGPGRAVPGVPRDPARPAGAVGRAAGAVPAARHLEGQRRRGLPVRRPLARPAAGRAGRRGDRAALPRARSARPPPPTSRPGRASPGSVRWSRRWTTWSPTRTSNGKPLYDVPGLELADEDARRRCGCSASTTTSGSPTPAVTGSPTPESRPAGWASTAGWPARSSPTACSSASGGSPTAASRCSPPSVPSPGGSSPSSTTRSAGSTQLLGS